MMVLGALWRSLVLTTLIGCMFVGNINGASKIKGLATMIKKFNTFTPLQNFEIPLEPENTLATSFYTKEKGNEPAFYQRYTDLMRRGITDDTKFMVFRKHPKAMGWGNRIRGTISSFVLALLTGRVMIIEHEMFESHFLPYERDGVLVDWRPLLAKDICTKENTKWVQKDMMTNVDIKTELAEKRCLFYSQPYAFDEQMQKNPAFKDSFQELFGTDSRMERTRQISHMLMANPSKHYRKLAQELKEAIGYDQYDHHVSVQLRMFYDWPRIRERVLGQIDSYWGCVNRVFNGLAHPSEGDGVPKAKRMIFFTTDDNSMRETAIEHLSPYGTVVFNDHAVEHTSKIGQRHTNSALLDWYMVGEVNAVTTIGSSFGPLAWARPSLNAEIEEGKGLYYTPHRSWGFIRHCGLMPKPHSQGYRDLIVR